MKINRPLKFSDSTTSLIIGTPPIGIRGFIVPYLEGGNLLPRPAIGIMIFVATNLSYN